MCCNRIIVSRHWRYCPFCGGPLVRSGEHSNAVMKRNGEPVYRKVSERLLNKQVRCGLLEEEIREQMLKVNHLKSANGRLRKKLDEAEKDAGDLRSVVDLAMTSPLHGKITPKSAASEPGIVEGVGVDGGDLLVQQAVRECGYTPSRGRNAGVPCSRLADHPGKHGY